MPQALDMHRVKIPRQNDQPTYGIQRFAQIIGTDQVSHCNGNKQSELAAYTHTLILFSVF
jgi:hypothetical protein